MNTKRPPVRFASLFHPRGVDEFLEHYYEKQTLCINREDKKYFSELLNGDDIDRLFQCTAIPRSVVRCNKEGNEIPAERFCGPGGTATLVSIDRLLKLFGAGHTIVINSGDRLLPKVDRFCNELEQELRFRVQPNIYITPFDAQGFVTHYDDHDVFILQVMGSKNWRIFDSPVELPSRRQSWNRQVTAAGDPQMEVTLFPGDTLYIPRGVMHDASTNGVSSAHITLGLHPSYRFDLLQELTYLAQDMPEFRKAVPLGLLGEQDLLAAKRKFKKSVQDLIDQVEVGELVERRYADFVSKRRPECRSRFRDLARLNEVNLDTIVRRRDSVLFLTKKDEKSITISFSENEVSIQPFLESALDSLLSDRPFAVGEIKGLLSDQGRIELANKFLQAGFLEIVEAS